MRVELAGLAMMARSIAIIQPVQAGVAGNAAVALA